MTLEPSADAEARAGEFSQRADLCWVAGVLAQQRDKILARWLEAARRQPFHHGKPERAIADEMPLLFDSAVAVLQRSAPRWVDAAPLLDDPAVMHAANNHAQVRFTQGLKPADIVTEFRLLRQEIGRTLRVHLADSAPASDILAAELLIHDALDGAIALALNALSEQVEDVRQDFLATTVHDLQQPLATIKGRLQLAVRQLRQPRPRAGEAAEGLEAIANEIDRLTRMLANLADASRLALGKFELRRTPVDLVELVHAASARLPVGEAPRLRLDVPDRAITGDWDRDLIERVLENVLSNAVKYSPPATPIDISIHVHAGMAQLAVHNEGIGLSPKELELVFERYHRTASAVQRGIGGQGLGLYLARGVVVAHGGRIWLDSPGSGFGATVHVRLPLRAPEAASA